MIGLINKSRRLRISKKLVAVGVIVTTALLLVPTPAAALFGLGDIVFDPTSYATLAKIWSSDASTLTKVTEEARPAPADLRQWRPDLPRGDGNGSKRQSI